MVIFRIQITAQQTYPHNLPLQHKKTGLISLLIPLGRQSWYSIIGHHANRHNQGDHQATAEMQREDLNCFTKNNGPQKHTGTQNPLGLVHPGDCGGWKGPLCLSQYTKGCQAHTIYGFIKGCTCLISLSPEGGSSISVRVCYLYTGILLLKNRQRMNNSRHKNGSFPTPAFLAFPDAELLWVKILSLTNLVLAVPSQQSLVSCYGKPEWLTVVLCKLILLLYTPGKLLFQNDTNMSSIFNTSTIISIQIQPQSPIFLY